MKRILIIVGIVLVAGAAITHRLFRGLDPAAPTITDVLKKAGYVTGIDGMAYETNI